MENLSKKEVAYKYRQGSGWIVGTWDASVNSFRLSNEMTYWAACKLIKSTREDWDTKAQDYKYNLEIRA